MSELRQDLIKSAVSFLSSPNVQSAEKEKKIAFLQKKGLNQAEIDEAFQQTDNTDVQSNQATATTATATTTATTTPALPSRTHYPNYTTPQIIYYPQPPATMPAERVFALAVLVGMGTVGLTASIVGILRRLILPILNRIANYQRTRYNQRQVVAERLDKQIKAHHTENDDLDALIDQGDEKTACEALVKHQAELQHKLDQLVHHARQHITKRPYYDPLRTELTSFKTTLMSLDSSFSSSTYTNGFYSRSPDSPVVSGLKSDIRSLKAVMLNRRNFPST